MRVGILDWETACERLEPVWQTRLRAAGAHPSLLPGWLEAAAAAHRQEHGLRVAVGDDGDALLPFFHGRRRMWGIDLPSLELAGNLVAYHQEVIAEASPEQLLLALARQSRWQVLVAEEVPDGGRTATALQAVAERLGADLLRYPGDASPYLPIESDWEEFLSGRGRDFRYRLRREWRRLEAAGEFGFRHFHSASDVEELLGLMLAVEERSWKREAGMAIGASRVETAYYRRLLPWLARSGMLAADVLYLNGCVAAYSLCYRFDGRMGQLKTSFDQRFAALSPGAVLTRRVIQDAFEEGMKEFDFLGGQMEHKRRWTERVRRHSHWFLFARRWPGRGIGRLKRLGGWFRKGGHPQTSTSTAGG
jgi:CelD/BcsL family acetyltransferase involved in cellulose biosynthesis